MRLDPWIVLAIVSMALATYATRAGGYWLFSRFTPPDAVRTMLTYVPGTLFISFVTPSIINGGWKEWIGALVTLAVAMRTRSPAWPSALGTAAAWISAETFLR